MFLSFYSRRTHQFVLLGMSIQDLLQKDVKGVSGPNIHLLISSLPSEYTVEVNDRTFEYMLC